MQFVLIICIIIYDVVEKYFLRVEYEKSMAQVANLQKWIISGTQTPMICLSGNSVAGWGNNGYSELNNATQPSDPRIVTFANGKTVAALCAGADRAIVVFTDGTVQGIGNNQFGSLGTGDYNTTKSVYTSPTGGNLINKKVIKACMGTIGTQTSYLLDSSGVVYLAGTDNVNFLSSGNSQQTYFAPLTLVSNISTKFFIDIAPVTNGLLLIDSSKKIYLLGSFNYLFGVGNTLTEKTLPNGYTAKQIFAGGSRAFVLCTDGSLFRIGRVSGASDGFPDSSGNVSELTQVSLPSGQTVKWVGVGTQWTLIVTEQGNVYGTGDNSLGQLGIGNNTNQPGWAQVTSLASGVLPVAIQCGNYVSILIYSDGTVQTTGRNNVRQLGDGTTTSRNVFTNIAQVGGVTLKSITTTGLDTKPDAPTITTVTPGNQQVSVSFTQPANGGSAISSYTVTPSPSGTPVTGASNTLIVTGLTNGQAYTFTVKATNGMGDSASSSESASVTPRTVPGAPTGVSAVGANRQATVSFTPPVSTGGSVITGYTVTSSPGNIDVSGASSPLTVTGLTNGTTYTFTVKATNVAGSSVASTSSSSVTPSVSIPDLNSGNISTVDSDIVVGGSRVITAKKQAKSAGAVTYAPDAANKPSVTISSIPASVQDITVGVAAPDASGIAVVKIVAQAANGSLVTNFVETPLTVRVTLPGFTSNMVTIQTSATLGGSITDTITAYKVGTNLYEFTTTHLTYFSASEYVPCFVAGTRILTAEGYKAVETLTADDLIRTADNRIVSFRMFTTHIVATSPETAPYTIPANTFGRACPATEMTISPYHAIQSAPGVWQIPKYASQMFSGITQAQPGQPITYYHLELPNYFKDNIVAEGTIVESYGNRQTAGMKAVYRLNAERTGFTRMEKVKSASKTA